MSLIHEPRRAEHLPPRLRCDQRGCRRTVTADERRWDRGWEVLGGVFNTYDFCSEAHLLAYQTRCPDWYDRNNI